VSDIRARTPGAYTTQGVRPRTRGSQPLWSLIRPSSQNGRLLSLAWSPGQASRSRLPAMETDGTLLGPLRVKVIGICFSGVRHGSPPAGSPAPASGRANWPQPASGGRVLPRRIGGEYPPGRRGLSRVNPGGKILAARPGTGNRRGRRGPDAPGSARGGQEEPVTLRRDRWQEVRHHDPLQGGRQRVPRRLAGCGTGRATSRGGPGSSRSPRPAR